MDIYNLKNNNFITLIENIKNNFNYTGAYINTLQQKNINIKKIIQTFSSKKTLKLSMCINNLNFQYILLNNELEYISKTNSIILKKIYVSIYDLAENVIMIASSLDNINEEYDDTDNTQNLLNKISPIKKIDNKYNIDNIISLVHSLIENLKIIQTILEHFNNFINTTDEQMKSGNYHCKNLKTILNNQKNHLVLEYNNYCNCLEGNLIYYNNISKKMVEQFNNKSLTDFLCMEPKKQDTSILSESINEDSTNEALTNIKSTNEELSSDTSIYNKSTNEVHINEEHTNEEHTNEASKNDISILNEPIREI